VATVVIDPSGSVSLATLSGSWALVDRGQRIYRVTWPKIQDTVTVSEDLSRIKGGNQYGVAVSGVRLSLQSTRQLTREQLRPLQRFRPTRNRVLNSLIHRID
jgi:hypothetical protein